MSKFKLVIKSSSSFEEDFIEDYKKEVEPFQKGSFEYKDSVLVASPSKILLDSMFLKLKESIFTEEIDCKNKRLVTPSFYTSFIYIGREFLIEDYIAAFEFSKVFLHEPSDYELVFTLSRIRSINKLDYSIIIYSDNKNLISEAQEKYGNCMNKVEVVYEN